MNRRILDHLVFLYGEEPAQATASKLAALLARCHRELSPAHPAANDPDLSQRDTLLIIYTDRVRALDESPSGALVTVTRQPLQSGLNCIQGRGG